MPRNPLWPFRGLSVHNYGSNLEVMITWIGETLNQGHTGDVTGVQMEVGTGQSGSRKNVGSPSQTQSPDLGPFCTSDFAGIDLSTAWSDFEGWPNWLGSNWYVCERESRTLVREVLNVSPLPPFSTGNHQLTKQLYLKEAAARALLEVNLLNQRHQLHGEACFAFTFYRSFMLSSDFICKQKSRIQHTQLNKLNGKHAWAM